MPMPDPTQQKSGYETSRTLQQEAQNMLIDLLGKLDAGDVDHYAEDRYRAVQYTIAGGGPGADVTFILDSDGDVREAILGYYEPSGRAYVPVPDWAVRKLYKAFRAYGGGATVEVPTAIDDDFADLAGEDDEPDEPELHSDEDGPDETYQVHINPVRFAQWGPDCKGSNTYVGSVFRSASTLCGRCLNDVRVDDAGYMIIHAARKREVPNE